MSTSLGIPERRRYRGIAAERLAALMAMPDAGAYTGTGTGENATTPNDGDVAAPSELAVDWAMLETLPHWCVLDDEARERLQRTAGALFLLPLWRDGIDGKLHRAIREQVGAAVYRHLVNDAVGPEASGVREHLDDGRLVPALHGAGAAVLLATLVPSLVPLFVPVVGEPSGRIPGDTGDTLYRRAATLMAEARSPVGAEPLSNRGSTPAPAASAP